MKLHYKISLIVVSMFIIFTHLNGMKSTFTDHYIKTIRTSDWDDDTKIHLLELLAWNFFDNPITRSKYARALRPFGKEVPTSKQSKGEEGIPKLSNPQQPIPEITDDALKNEIATIMQKLSTIKIRNFNYRITRNTKNLNSSLTEIKKYPIQKIFIQQRIDKLIAQQLDTLLAKMAENPDLEELKKDEQSLLFLQNIPEKNEMLSQKIESRLQQNKARQNELQGIPIVLFPTIKMPAEITEAPEEYPKTTNNFEPVTETMPISQPSLFHRFITWIKKMLSRSGS